MGLGFGFNLKYLGSERGSPWFRMQVGVGMSPFSGTGQGSLQLGGLELGADGMRHAMWTPLAGLNSL